MILPFRHCLAGRRAAGPLPRRAAGLFYICSSFGFSRRAFHGLRPPAVGSGSAMPSQFLALLACVPLMAPAAAIGTILSVCMGRKGKAKAQPKAAALDHNELNRMLSSLRYQASDKCNDQEKRKAAKEAQTKWNSLMNQDDKKRFLKMWDDNGRGKSADSLKFAVKFEQFVDHQQQDEFASRDKYLIPAQILKQKGYSFTDFDTRKEALAFAVVLYEENAKEFDTKEAHPPCIHDTNEELSRYFFVEDEGHRTSWKQTQSKKITGGTDVKNANQLVSVCNDMGFPSALAGSSSDSQVQVKDEDPAIPEVKEKAKMLKTEGGNSLSLLSPRSAAPWDQARWSGLQGGGGPRSFAFPPGLPGLIWVGCRRSRRLCASARASSPRRARPPRRMPRRSSGLTTRRSSRAASMSWVTSRTLATAKSRLPRRRTPWTRRSCPSSRRKLTVRGRCSSTT